MKGCITIICILFSLVISHCCIAQNLPLKFNLVEGPGGKSFGKINAIGQDPHGYMWFASQGEKCLYRYDGSRIVTFRHDDNDPNSLGVVSIETMFADADGMIWIGGNGLDQYNTLTGNFKHFRHRQNDEGSLGNNDIKSILKDHHGRLWVGTSAGIDRLDEKTGKFIHYHKEPGNEKSLSCNFIWRIYEDRQGVIWIATGDPWEGKDPEDGGLNRFNEDGSFTRFVHNPNDPQSLINNKVAAMFEDDRGVFWVGTGGDGLHTMDRNTGRFERHQYNPQLPDQLSRPPLYKGEVNDKITFITGDITGAIWIGTMYSGINRFDPVTKKILHFVQSNGFPDSTSWTAYTSKDGEFWIATEHANLFRVDPFSKPITRIPTQTVPNSFLEDKDGYLWVGTGGNGLLKYDQHNNLIQQFKSDALDPGGLPDNYVGPLFQNEKNTLLVGSFSGLRILNTATRKFSNLQDVAPLRDSANTGFAKIMQDRKGILWFARWGLGLVSFNPKDRSFKHFLSNEEDSTTLVSNQLNQVLEDRSGKLWISGIGGINQLNRKSGRFKQYLQGTFVTYLYEDSGGNLWAGTEKGLFRYNEKEDRFISFFDPMSDIHTLTVGGIIEDNANQLWLSSSLGIIKLNTSTKEVYIYGRRYGVSLNSMSAWTQSFKNKNGKLFMGYESGFYTFYPEDLKVSPRLNIIITELFINSLPVLPGKESPLKIPIEETREFTLTYSQNNIALNFSAIDYQSPEATRYFTMLENYDNTWREARSEKSSYYFNIPPGDYKYRIKAYYSDGVKEEKLISIHISPPWWKTWWAYTLYGLLFLTAIFFIYRIQKQRILRLERQKAQQIELAQAKEIEKAYHELRSTQALLIQSEKMASLGELTAGIAHEIQNPLNFVNNFSDLNQDLINELKEENSKGNSHEVNNLADIIKDNEDKINFHGRRADAIVKSMLQHSRTSTGQKEPVDINALADEYLRLAYHGLRAKEKSFNASLQTDYDPAVGKVNVISQDIGRLLLNLYNNAFYAVMEKQKEQDKSYEPLIIVSTKMKGTAPSRQVLISIKDNGAGIPQKVLDKIFQPFFTTKPTGQGTGLGLSLSYDIIKAHNGEIKVDTREGEYTNFIIHLPLT